MRFVHETERQDYTDLASGRVLHSVVGAAPLPVRLICEVFQRCAAFQRDLGVRRRLVVYDPFCGTGYLLTVIGLLHRGLVSELWGSDIDPAILRVAQANLALLSESGILARKRRLRELAVEFGKESHAEAVDSACRLRSLVDACRGPSVGCFAADALRDKPQIPDAALVDLVLADLPYGKLAEWQGGHGMGCPPEDALMQNCASWMRAGALLALFSSKNQRFEHPRFHRCVRLRHGRRQIWIFRRLT